MIKVIAAAAIVILIIIVVVITLNVKTTSRGGPTYMGCYADNGSDRAFDNKFRQDVDLNTCFTVGNNAGVKYIGYQGEPNGNTGTCWYGDSYNKHGKATDCIVKDSAGNIIGQWDLAVYQIA
jgi:hypothetical protein